MAGTTEHTPGGTDWGTAIVVDPKELRRLQEDSRRLHSRQRRRAVVAMLLLGISALSASLAYRQHSSVSRLRVKVRECRQNATRTNTPYRAASSLESEPQAAAPDSLPLIRGGQGAKELAGLDWRQPPVVPQVQSLWQAPGQAESSSPSHTSLD